MAKKSRKTEAKRKPRPSHINVGEDRDYSRQATMVKASGMPSQKSKSRKTADAKKSNSGHKYHRSAYLTNSLEPRFLGRQSIQSSTNTSSDRKDKFGRGGRMITEAKTQSLAKKNLEFSQSSPLNKDPTPPVSLEWTEVRIIVSDHGERIGLGSLFSSIAQDCEVSVCKIEPHVVQIVGKSRAALKKATAQLHSHLGRLNATNAYKRIHFLVQPSYKALDMDKPVVQCYKGGRPRVVSLADVNANLFSDATKIQTKQLKEDFPTAASVLMSFDVPFKMRVNFGKLTLNQGLSDCTSLFTYSALATMLNTPFISRDAAFERRLSSEYKTAINTVKHLIDPAIGFSESPDSIRQRFELSIQIREKCYISEAESHIGKPPRLSAPKCYSSTEESLLSWVVAAPDMALDWSIEVSSIPGLQLVPEDVDRFIRKLDLVTRGDSDPVAFLGHFPTLRGNLSNEVGRQVKQTELKHSVLIPIHGFPYTVGISITQQWPNSWMEPAERSYIALELFGQNWDEGINKRTCDGKMKDWGQGFSHIFPSSSIRLEDGLDEFVRTIYQVLYLWDCTSE